MARKAAGPARSRRACMRGSSGRENGSLSITSNDSAEPGTSTPCQKPMVANRHELSSSLKAASRAGFGSSSWVSTRQGSPGERASAAARMARQLVNRANVRPPAARMSASSSACMAVSYSGRRGSGRWVAQ